MSGAFGWTGNRGSSSSSSSHTPSAVDAYRSPPPRSRASVRHVDPDLSQVISHTPAPSRSLHNTAASMALSTPTAKHALKSTAANVLIVVGDTTGSMGDNPQEIFRRLPRLYHDAVKYLGSDDLEILFITHRDARCDNHAIQVTRFGRGQELDTLLASFYMNRNSGGGQGSESQELVAYYLLKQVDTTSARNVYCYFITDEMGCDRIESYLARRELNLAVDPELSNTNAVFQMLARKMSIFCVLFDPPSYYSHHDIKGWWERMLGTEKTLPLNDARRIVDVILGSIAVITDQLDVFTKDLRSRQIPTRHGLQNVQAVMKSISMVGKGTDSDPYVPRAKTRPLLTGPTPGTKSLLDK